MFDICKCAKSGQRKPLFTLNIYIVVKDQYGKRKIVGLNPGKVLFMNGMYGWVAPILKFWVIWVNTI